MRLSGRAISSQPRREPDRPLVAARTDFAVVAIYRSPPGAPGAFVTRAQRLAPDRPLEWNGEPTFHADLDAARATVPDGFRYRKPSKRDRRELPLLIEVWIEPQTGSAP